MSRTHPLSIVTNRYLDLHTNGLNGSIPANLSALQQLQMLDLSSNQLAGGSGVAPFTNLTALRCVRVRCRSPCVELLTVTCAPESGLLVLVDCTERVSPCHVRVRPGHRRALCTP